MHLPALTAYSDPVEKGFQGGDRDGVNCLYLMPIDVPPFIGPALMRVGGRDHAAAPG